MRGDVLPAWVRESGDPDVPVIDWLLNGAPAGIDYHPENVGIFPTAYEPPTNEWNLCYYSEEATNYTSMDESPHGEEVLNNLVKEGVRP